jgi:hypothetical protein
MSNPKLEEYCQNCGMVKFMHVNMDKFIGTAINEQTYDALLAEAVEKHELFGNLCLDWKRDNLKYLESLCE